jgi:hypothetical protein
MDFGVLGCLFQSLIFGLSNLQLLSALLRDFAQTFGHHTLFLGKVYLVYAGRALISLHQAEVAAFLLYESDSFSPFSLQHHDLRAQSLVLIGQLVNVLLQQKYIVVECLPVL